MVLTNNVVVSDNGSKSWYINRKLHREDGPAIEDIDGSKSWFINGKLHREDGPAIEYANGYKAWYINDEKLTESEFLARQSCTDKTGVIDGKAYKLVAL
jgi:hypothetical protein